MHFLVWFVVSFHPTLNRIIVFIYIWFSIESKNLKHIFNSLSLQDIKYLRICIEKWFKILHQTSFKVDHRNKENVFVLISWSNCIAIYYSKFYMSRNRGIFVLKYRFKPFYWFDLMNKCMIFIIIFPFLRWIIIYTI